MANRTAKFISALVASLFAGIPLSAESQDAPAAPAAQTAAAGADDCLTSPKGAAPQGQHWHYRLERSTKRQCWYLRAESAKPAQAAQASTPAPKVAQSPSKSVQDARAEWTAQQTTSPAAPAPSVTPNTSVASADPQPSSPAVETRWPDPAEVAAAPAPEPAPAPKAAETRVASKAPVSAKASAVALASAEAPAEKQVGSLQMLLLVIGGALAAAGIIGSVIYRLARAGVRAESAKRRVNWDEFEPAEQECSPAPWAHASTANISRELESPRLATYLDDDAADEVIKTAPDHDHEKDEADALDVGAITAILERLANEGPRLNTAARTS